MAETNHQPTQRVLSILEALANKTEGLGLSELAKEIGSSKGTISPIVHTLAQHKFIALVPGTGKYRIGIGAYCVGISYTDSRSVLGFFREQMQQVVDETGEICQMGVLDGGHILYVAKVDSPEPIRIISHVGARLPAYCTALGKALLSERAIDDIRALYPDGLAPLTDRTITDFTALEEELAKVKESGVAFELGEGNPESGCMAVPLQKGGEGLAAISVSIPIFRMTPEKLETVRKVLTDARRRIELYLHNHDIDTANLTIQR